MAWIRSMTRKSLINTDFITGIYIDAGIVKCTLSVRHLHDGDLIEYNLFEGREMSDNVAYMNDLENVLNLK